MAKRSNRNKIRFQVESAIADLKKAQIHLVQAAGIADGGSPHIDNDLPLIITSLEMIIDSTGGLYQVL